MLSGVRPTSSASLLRPILRSLAWLTSASGSRLPPLAPPNLNEQQQQLYDDITESRVKVVGREAVFDESGGLRGPWQAEVLSPRIGVHLERLASAVRHENSLEPRVYEVAILVVGVHWQAQFEWFAHEAIARKAGVNAAALPLIKAAAPAEELEGLLQPDELAAYRCALELVSTKRVSAQTYAATKTALGGNDQRMVDLCMTMGCYHAVSNILNMFDVPLPRGEPLPFPEPEPR
jgi:4-carboxymuconolactone decarboxylase